MHSATGVRKERERLVLDLERMKFERSGRGKGSTGWKCIVDTVLNDVQFLTLRERMSHYGDCPRRPLSPVSLSTLLL